MLYGHTSWENSRYTHFEIPLSTGWLTTRWQKARQFRSVCRLSDDSMEFPTCGGMEAD